MKHIVFATLLLFAGCNVEIATTDNWDNALQNYHCSNEILSKVERETKFCSEHTGYLGSYCLGTAMMRNCDKIERAAPKGEE